MNRRNLFSLTAMAAAMGLGPKKPVPMTSPATSLNDRDLGAVITKNDAGFVTKVTHKNGIVTSITITATGTGYKPLR